MAFRPLMGQELCDDTLMTHMPLGWRETPGVCGAGWASLARWLFSDTVTGYSAALFGLEQCTLFLDLSMAFR